MALQEVFAETLIEFRKANYLTQKELGKILGVSTATINRWEKKWTKPALKNVRKVLSIIGKK